jgi:DNA-binding CsgD family transcriptional regulator/tetratricopeptide (TPR) repeat protein
MPVRQAVGMPSAVRHVGRSAELALAAAAVRELGDGRVHALTVEGEAGIGKTHLVQVVADEARARDLAVCYGRAHPFERARPFGVVAEALDLRRHSPDPRRAAVGALLTGQVGAGDGQPTGDLQYRVVEEVVDLVESACAERPMVLVAEDVHWADAASLSTLSAIARRLTLSSLLLVVTTRPAPLPPLVARLLDDLASAGAVTLRLRPLEADEVAGLAQRELGAPPGPVLAELLRKAGGNPLWAKAVLRTLAAEGMLRPEGGTVETTSTQLPASLSDLVDRRLQDLSPPTLELLRVTAVLGDAVWVRDVAAVSGRPAVEVVRGLAEAFDAQLLDEADDRVVFRHQLVHDAIYQHTPAPARRLLHREAAEVLTAAGADRLEVADHLLLGADPGDLRAVTWLREAAGDAAAHAPLVTVDLLLRAEALLPPGSPDADGLAAEIVPALLRAGRVAEASQRAEALLAGPHAPELDTPVRLALLGALALQNRAAELVEVVRASLIGPAPLLPHEQVPMLAQQSWAMTYSGDHRAGEQAARQALAIAEGAGADALTVWALTALLVAVGRAGRYEEALDHARRAAALAAAAHDARSLPLQPKLFVGLSLFDCDRVEEARAAYRDALDDEFGTGFWLSDTLMADAQAAFVVGEWDDAVPSLVAGGQAAQEKGNPLLLSQSQAYRLVIATATGDLAAARDLAEGLSPWTGDDGDRLAYNGGVIAAALAGLALAEGDRRSAYDLLLRCWRASAEHDDRFYHRVLAPDLVRLALELGHADVATEVTEAVAADVELAPGVPSVRGVALRCRGLLTGDVEPLLEAVALARRAPLLVEHTGACEDAAGLLAASGRGEEARALLTEALERHERAGADAWAGRVRARLRALGVHPGPKGLRRRPTAGWASLTSTEQAVSLLVAEGLTNGAVARRLYISPHTVNTHLRHVFGKLGVSNRVALAGVVHRSIE